MFLIRMKWMIAAVGASAVGLAVIVIVLQAQQAREELNSTALYQHHSIEPRYPFGHISAQDVSDIDLDGYPDIVIRSGKSGEAEIAWYQNPLGDTGTKPQLWRKHRLASDPYPKGGNASGSAVLVYDVNRDGRPDVITGARHEVIGNGLFWWEAPEDPRAGNWRRHLIAAPDPTTGEEFAPHDLLLTDIDQDGHVDLLIGGSSNQGVHWARFPRSPKETANWQLQRIGGPRGAGHAGLAVGDIDGDGRGDVVHADFWYRAGGPLSDPVWQGHAYGLINRPPSNIALYDVDADGRLDIVAASGHDGEKGAVVWYKAGADPTRPWRPNRISTGFLAAPESLVMLASPSGTGPLVVTAELDFLRVNKNPRMVLYSPTDDSFANWQETVLFSGKNFRSLRAIDLDKDGDIDLSAISFAGPKGYAHVGWFENTSQESHGQHGTTAAN